MSTLNPFDYEPHSPQMGLAMGLLQAGGPSRMPVSLGQALGQGLQAGEQYAAQDRSSALDQLRLLMALQRLRQVQAAGALSQQAGTSGNNP